MKYPPPGLPRGCTSWWWTGVDVHNGASVAGVVLIQHKHVVKIME